MSEKKIDIELRLVKSAAVFSWEVFLENTADSSRVEDGWDFEPVKKYFYVTLDNYPIADAALDVYVGCEGKIGGSVSCTVYIDGKEQERKVECRNTDPDYGHESYPLLNTFNPFSV